MRTGVLLYGPPAVGKDTVTAELEQLGRFAHFRRLKCGPGRSAGYRMIEPEVLAALAPDDLLYVNRRYGATYIVDRPGLDELWRAGQIPVVHLGQPEAIDVLIEATPGVDWLTVELWSPLHVLRDRITARQTGDELSRLEVARETPRLAHPDLVIDTGEQDPPTAAAMITERLNAEYRATSWR